jgi:hypothetical protein
MCSSPDEIEFCDARPRWLRSRTSGGTLQKYRSSYYCQYKYDLFFNALEDEFAFERRMRASARTDMFFPPFYQVLAPYSYQAPFGKPVANDLDINTIYFMMNPVQL